MRCISPLLVRVKGERNWVPCGKCNFCLQTKRGDWTFRIQQELKHAKAATFLTMTYNDDHVPINRHGQFELDKRDVQLFKKRLRKDVSKISDYPLRYYTVGEYGTRTNRPHYHSIMFNLPPSLHARLPSIWQLGHIHAGTVTTASIHYTTKYVINRHGDFGTKDPPFSLMSKRPGIGAQYLKTHTNWHRADMRSYTQVNGFKARLPRYYRDKIFTNLEREIMALDSVAQGDEAYWEEIERLEKFHEDPEAYYQECIVNCHESITLKLNDKNKL